MFRIGDKWTRSIHLFRIVKLNCLNRKTMDKAELILALPEEEIGFSTAHGKRNDQCTGQFSVIDHKRETLANKRE